MQQIAIIYWMVNHEFSSFLKIFCSDCYTFKASNKTCTAMPIRWMVLSWLIYHVYKNTYNNVQLLPIYMIRTYISFELSFNIQTLPRHTHNQNLIFFIFENIVRICRDYAVHISFRKTQKIIYMLSLDRNHRDRLTLYWYIHL